MILLMMVFRWEFHAHSSSDSKPGKMGNAIKWFWKISALAVTGILFWHFDRYSRTYNSNTCHNKVGYQTCGDTSDPINLHYEEIIKELKELLEMKIVEFSNSEYSLPLLPIKKKDGSLRLCLDYRKLNTITLVPQEPLPNLECFFTKLSKAIYFQRFDLSGGYWQIPLEKNL